MKELKVITNDFGTIPCKVRRVFEVDNVRYAIVKMPYKHMEQGNTYYTDKCIHVNSGGQVPTFSSSNKTLKGFVEDCKSLILRIKKDLGEVEFYRELDSWKVINI